MTTAGHFSVLTALIADDEALARRRILELLSGRETIRVVGQCETGPATLNAVRELSPDVLFLDVQMPGLTGFEVLAMLRPEERPIVIFSTAYDEYALAAFEVNAVDYLLKPFADDRFEESLQRAEHAIRNERANDLHDRLRNLLGQVGLSFDGHAEGGHAPQTYLDRFAVRRGERLGIVDAPAIDWIEAAQDYVKLRVGADAYLIRATMAALERRLDPRRFVRIHRSAIVQLDRIGHLDTDAHGDYVAVLKGGERLRVGRRYRLALLERLGLRW